MFGPLLSTQYSNEDEEDCFGLRWSKLRLWLRVTFVRKSLLLRLKRSPGDSNEQETPASTTGTFLPSAPFCTSHDPLCSDWAKDERRKWKWKHESIGCDANQAKQIWSSGIWAHVIMEANRLENECAHIKTRIARSFRNNGTYITCSEIMLQF